MIDRVLVKKLLKLRAEAAEVGDPFYQVNVGTVAIIGASNSSGFGPSLAQGVLRSHPENRVILTGRDKGFERLKETVSAGVMYDPDRTEVMELDVLQEPTPTGKKVNHLVVCAATMDPKYLKRSVRFDDIPEIDKEKSRRTTVGGIGNVAKMFTYHPFGSIWGVSFAGHDFPAYNIGPIKKELEDVVTKGKALVPGVRQNILSLGVFPSVAGLAIEGFEDTARIYEALGIRNPGMREMVYGTLDAFVEATRNRTIVNLDGGLRDALADPAKREAYQKFCQSLRAA